MFAPLPRWLSLLALLSFCGSVLWMLPIDLDEQPRDDYRAGAMRWGGRWS